MLYTECNFTHYGLKVTYKRWRPVILKDVPPTVPIRVITRACLTTYNSHFSVDLWPSAQKLYVERNKAKLSSKNKHVTWRLLRTLTHMWFNQVNLYKVPNTLSVTLSYFTVWCHTWQKNWVNCAVLTGNSASLRTVLSSHLSHRELHSSLRESHSFLSLPADTMTASSQGTSVSSNSVSRWASHDIFLFKYHFLLHILHILFSLDNIMANVASKQHTTALFLTTSHT
jgi:hypothetical protein